MITVLTTWSCFNCLSIIKLVETYDDACICTYDDACISPQHEYLHNLSGRTTMHLSELYRNSHMEACDKCGNLCEPVNHQKWGEPLHCWAPMSTYVPICKFIGGSIEVNRMAVILTPPHPGWTNLWDPVLEWIYVHMRPITTLNPRCRIWPITTFQQYGSTVDSVFV